MTDRSIKFDRAAGFYDDTRGFPAGEAQAAVNVIYRGGRLSAESRVFEVGVGTGRIALPLSETVRVFVGADLSRPMMERLRDKPHTRPVYLQEANATQLPFADQSFDAVIAVDVLHLIADWRRALVEIARVLRRGAPLVYAWGGVGMHDLRALWNSVILRQDIGLRFSDEGGTLLDLGWQAFGAPQSHTFAYAYRPSDYIASLRGRIWSGTWRLSDDDIDRGVAAVEAYMRENNDDPGAPVSAEGAFHAAAYLPPE